jgi:hypothetical protein
MLRFGLGFDRRERLAVHVGDEVVDVRRFDVGARQHELRAARRSDRRFGFADIELERRCGGVSDFGGERARVDGLEAVRQDHLHIRRVRR